jgi:hypothetical protein
LPDTVTPVNCVIRFTPPGPVNCVTSEVVKLTGLIGSSNTKVSWVKGADVCRAGICATTRGPVLSIKNVP